MPLLKLLERWFDIRPSEIRKVVLCTLGAFLLIASVVLARSIREGLFLTVFNAKNLPYVTAGTACLSLPAVGLFAAMLGRFHPWIVLQRVLILFSIGLGVIWGVSQYVQIVAVVFYIWTAIGALLLTSGFWVLTAESFAVRGAKRLFGLIAGGGTAGAMVMGFSLNWIAAQIRFIQLVPCLIGILLLLYLVEYWIYRLPKGGISGKQQSIDSGNKDSGNAGWVKITVPHDIKGNLGTILGSPYLGSIAAIVFVATVVSSIVDYQFKEFAQINIGGGEKLTGFFGAFYGWAGGIALAVQLLLTARLMGSAGVTFALCLLPGLLLFGSTGFLVFPGLVVVTLVRGGDNTLRKSILRPMLEFLYVPVPTLLRRKTKTFIDSFIDSVGEGTGAAVVYVWVVLTGGQSRYLSILVILLSLAMIFLSRRMGKQYLSTIVSRLKEGDAGTAFPAQSSGLKPRTSNLPMDLLTASFSRLDLQSIFDMTIMRRTDPKILSGSYDERKVDKYEPEFELTDPRNVASILQSSNNADILLVLEEVKEWDVEQIPWITRLLARDALQEAVLSTLARIGNSAVPDLSALLQDEEADFVIRRRIPRVLAKIGGQEAERSLLSALSAGRFEIRYRAVIALVNLKKLGIHAPEDHLKTVVWRAIRNEVQCSRPVWEMRRLLDSLDPSEDDKLIAKRVDTRSSLSLEHTFRMLTLVLDPQPVAAALHAILVGDEEFKSYALEYLERVLPADIRKSLWLFIGDASEARKEKETRPLHCVVSDLMSSRATLFHDETDRHILERMLKNQPE